MTPNLFKSGAQEDPPSSSATPSTAAPSSDRRDRPRKKGRAENGVISVFGAGLVVEGEVTSQGDITIEGRLEGNLHAEGQVSVAEQGVLDGHVRAERVVVAGRVDGTIEASDGARLVSGANVNANIQSPRLEVEEGATLNGTIDMGSKSAKTESPSSTSAASDGPSKPSKQKQGAA